MECRKFEITLISAFDLEVVRTIGKMKVHARVSIGSGVSGPGTARRTPTDTHGERNPAWNYTMNYTLNESMVQYHNTMLVIKLYCSRSLGDRYVGEVHTPLRALFDCAKVNGGSGSVSTFPVQRGCVNSQGGLKFSYRFGEKVMIDKLMMAESVSAWSHC